ncbi:lipoprotein N-acyltransferase Lnb domain-containing protein [Flavobacterium aurantiibacter]|uniref:Uncharacterized protein n=1 Tax=Flavobacterium aurantiibacter TaxID=2023067 RepID=A0A255ZS44_9FLAO|nr:hypothetical protein CHX27_08010 [Flavobacterium aurantiibacter]
MIRYLLLFFSFCFFSAKAQIPIASPNTKCSLLTVSAGNQLYSLYGHTGLRFYDEQQGFDFVVNFGYFDFSTPNFYLKFVKGDLKYFVGIDRYEDFYANYVFEQRGIKEQILNLKSSEIQSIINDLAAIVNSDGRFYTYKFFHRNCTTMVADLIAKHSSIKPAVINEIKEKSFRQIVSEYQSPLYFENLGINIMFGYYTDEKADAVFLPEQLFNAYKTQGQEVVSKTNTLNKASLTLDVPWWNSIFTLFVILITLVFVHEYVRKFLFVVLGFIGIFLAAAGLYSEHVEVLWNYNILLFNPLLLYFAFAEKKSVRRKTIQLLAAVFVLVHLIYVLNKSQLILFAPIYLTVFLLLLIDSELLTTIKQNRAKSLNHNI